MNSLHTAWMEAAESTGRACRAALRWTAPLLDLAVRLTIARAFFFSAIVKLANWETALLLAREEYPVSWMDPRTAAYLGVAVELAGSLLLALGLGTRVAAGSLLVLALVVQLNYAAFDQHLLWVALCAWFVVHGAGPLSLDRHLSKGLANSPLPFAGAGVRGLAELTRLGGPLVKLALRTWLALAILAADGWVALDAHVFAIETARSFVTPFVVGCAFAWWLGLATRAAAAATLIAIVCHAVSTEHAAGATVASFGTSLPYWLSAFGLIVINGPGPIALDHLLGSWLSRCWPRIMGVPVAVPKHAPRVVVVGAGFGGIACASRLADEALHVTLIDRRNYHLFQPLLYQVATAGLAPGDIAQPIRSVFRDMRNVRVLLGEVIGVRAASRELALASGQRIPYDYLVLATGASHSYFGRDEWSAHAPGLKRVEDATEVRRRLLLAFEQAEGCDDAAERDALLTFLIVGGGPTGVELAGAIAELARRGLDKEFRRFDPATARVILVQSGERLLPAFPESLSRATKLSLERLGVEVHLQSKVQHIDSTGVIVSGRRIMSRTVLWAAGVAASNAANWLNAPSDGAGRVKVGADLSVAGMANVFAVGDTAASNGWHGRPVPGLAPAAKQAGHYVAKVIAARTSGRGGPGPFRYRHLGSLATIGRKAAVADLGPLRLSGPLAWWLWGAVHVSFLLGVRNRVSVAFDWFWAYVTYKSSTRLITDAGQSTTPDFAAAVSVESVAVDSGARLIPCSTASAASPIAVSTA